MCGGKSAGSWIRAPRAWRDGMVASGVLTRCFVAGVLVMVGCAAESGSDGDETDTTSVGDTSASSPPADTGPVAGDTSGAGTSGGSTDGTENGTETETETDGGSSTGSEPVGSPGCRAATSLGEGEHQFMLDGNERRYILRLPRNYSTEQAWPLVFALHGNGGDPEYWDAQGGDRDIRAAFAQDAIIVIPEAINNQWRDYDADPESWPAAMELELNYFDAVLQAAQDELCVDTNHVFSMGFSGGGSFSGVLACRRSYIEAIAVGGSVIYFDEADCETPVAAWVTIGDGELTAGREAFRDFFRDAGGCSERSSPGAPKGCVDYGGCGGDTPVTFCAHPAGHVWPSIGTDATKLFFESMYAADSN